MVLKVLISGYSGGSESEPVYTQSLFAFSTPAFLQYLPQFPLLTRKTAMGLSTPMKSLAGGANVNKRERLQMWA